MMSKFGKCGYCEGNKGSSLVLALWCLFFLSVLALAVSAHVNAGIRIARSVKRDLRGRCAARSGVEMSIMTLLSDTNGWDALTEEWSRGEKLREIGNDDWNFSLLKVEDPRKGGYLPCELAEDRRSDMTSTNFGLVDEESKLNLNAADKNLIARFMEVAGELDSIAAETAASSIVDWRDGDGEQLPAGAEEGYYQTLSPSRPCRNGPMQSVHELLLVKGVNEELFRKIRPFVTVYGSGKINLNTADPLILKSLALYRGGDSSTADSIVSKLINFRRGGGAFDKAEAALITARLKEGTVMSPAEEALLSGMLANSTISSTCFRGMSFAKDANGGIKTISFVYDREKRIRLYWQE